VVFFVVVFFFVVVVFFVVVTVRRVVAVAVVVVVCAQKNDDDTRLPKSTIGKRRSAQRHTLRACPRCVSVTQRFILQYVKSRFLNAVLRKSTNSY